ncbi:hypothetical protein RvY_03200 [Ramazzottius varieornatus]|uniref:Mitochondrial import inner membrane translocase subunit n=1 Tax=Ramazzottius varieornatus TaxID=947166 RepID=A0A1D1UXE9_RAMVA|nr:hypothetical protein RvY_03200 [Ramazzottius varieornatus]
MTDKLSGAQKDELMQQVQQQLAVANFQELVTKATHKCYKMCIAKPGSSLSTSDQNCLAMCMDRYTDTYNHVIRVYTTKLQNGLQR